jgi:hypothetical protein
LRRQSASNVGLEFGKHVVGDVEAVEHGFGLPSGNFAYDGILRIQEALAAGEALSTDEIPIKIRLIAPDVEEPSVLLADHFSNLLDRLLEAVDRALLVSRVTDQSPTLPTTASSGSKRPSRPARPSRPTRSPSRSD